MIRTHCSRLATQTHHSLLRCSNAANSNNSTTAKSINAKSICTANQLFKATAQPSGSVTNIDKYLHYSPDEGYYKSSPYKPTTVLNKPLHEYAWQDLRKWENNVAAVCLVTGRQYTYAELRDASAALAVRFQKKFKLKHQDVVSICLPNLPEYPIATLGAIEAGLTVTTVNPIYTAEEIARQLDSSNAKFIIGSCDIYSTLQQSCQLIGKQLPIACIRTSNDDSLPAGAIDFFELISTDSVDFGDIKRYDNFCGDDTVFLPFSSGTTGLPKAVQLSHNNISANCEQIKDIVHIDSMVYQDTIPVILPFFHIYGLTAIMLSKVNQGSRLATMTHFKPEYLTKALHDYQASILLLVPPIAHFMINNPKLVKETAPKLRTIISGAAPISGTDVERLLDKFPQAQFAQGYGMTESSPLLLTTPHGSTRYASVGFPAGSTEAKIVAFEGNDFKGLGPNISGELCARGPQVMCGYLNNDKANQEIFLPGGWLRTGDVAHYDENGYFYITDRMKELIKVKGFQVPPAELEAVLRDHPKVLEAAVFAVPDTICGEVPRALVTLKPNTESNEKEIYDYVAERVAHYKRLEGGVVFGTEVPKNSTGKILRRTLKENYSKKN